MRLGSCSALLVDADLSANAVDQFLRIEADAVLEYGFYIFDIGDLVGRIPMNQDKIGLFAFGDATDAIGLS